ncbi:MAG: guanylate kinase [Acholeplasmataceae bacterium]|jgi:guanylate kinase
MIIIVGASASGKTEITKVLINKYNYHKCVTTTTREPRVGEVDGRDYHFLPLHIFLERVNNDEFVEFNEYRDNYYGIQKKDITDDAVVILEPHGANELLEQLGDQIFLVLVESSLEKRQERMIARGDNLEEVLKRLAQDDELFNKDKLLKVDLLIHNDQQTLEELATLIHTNYKNFQKNQK